MKYSIITINFNNKEGLRKTIESVIHQTFRDFEYIIIDGASTDGSKQLIEEYSNDIDYWVSEKDNGIYNAMNKGIKVSHGEYLIFMNSGDCFFNTQILERTIPYLHDEIVHGKMYDCSRQVPFYTPSKTPTMYFFYTGSLQHQACFFKRELFKDSLYDEHYKIVSDWKFFIEKIIFQNCTFSLIPFNIALYEGNGISATQKNTDAEERREVLTQILPPRIIADYERFKGKESPVLDLIPSFNRTYRLEKTIVIVIKIILRLYHLSLPLKKILSTLKHKTSQIEHHDI